MSKRFCIRFIDGPFPGTRVYDERMYRWPPPEEFRLPQGRYLRVRMSTLDPTDTNDHVIRGAEYEWQTREDGP